MRANIRVFMLLLDSDAEMESWKLKLLVVH